MGVQSDHSSLVLWFGVLGNIVSILVYLAPLPTFRKIYIKKSTLEYQSLPYVVALFSAMLWMYYALLKISDAVLLITINSLGCLIETIYIIFFLVYATNEARKNAVKQIMSLNVCFFAFILLFTWFQFHGPLRITVVGWVCVAISVSVFAAPLSIVFQVFRTRSVEYMPFTLSFFLTLSAVTWFAYGVFLHDMCIAIPNIFGFLLGLLQMLLYGIYRNTPKKNSDEEKMPEHIANMVVLGGPEVHPFDAKSCETEDKSNEIKAEDEKDYEKTISTHEKISVFQPPEEPNRATVQAGPSPPMLVVCAA